MNLCFHHETKVYRGWGFKGKHSGVYETNKNLSFSAILEFSELHFYGLLINEGSNDSNTFRYFLNQLVEIRENKF